ncbi:MAG: DUF1552 domain-containing protein [Pirellulaceae bacterium]|nr:DUF1552 domain-containing protein [Pirellulaceae bacterium]
MTLDRRTVLKGLAGGAAAGSFSWPCLVRGDAVASPPRRVIFFLQNHGFCPAHAQPLGIDLVPSAPGDGDAGRVQLDRVLDVPLADHRLPRWIDPLESIKDRVTILQGLNGKHVAPYHGAPYGALGGFKKSPSQPRGETIDCALAAALPAVVPLLAFGWEKLETMRATPIHYASSAWGANVPAPMYCSPLLAFDNLFGVAQAGTARAEFEAQTAVFEFAREDSARLDGRLGATERPKFAPYLESFETIARQRQRLLAMADTLQKNKPSITDQFTKPRFETVWWEAMLEVGLAALIAGVTNVLTLSSGCCTAGGSWLGLGLAHQGHSLGHTSQQEEDDWLKLRRYNMELVLRMVRTLEKVPEGAGSMMDNTVIVYTSCHGESQHSSGDRWPYILVGNFGGTLRTGRYLHYPIFPHAGNRSINALYATLLRGAGAPRERFNLDGPLKEIDQPGPIEELLA